MLDRTDKQTCHSAKPKHSAPAPRSHRRRGRRPAVQFAYGGFTGANLTLDGAATVTVSGLLMLTNVSSFSTTFVYPSGFFLLVRSGRRSSEQSYPAEHGASDPYRKIAVAFYYWAGGSMRVEFRLLPARSTPVATAIHVLVTADEAKLVIGGEVATGRKRGGDDRPVHRMVGRGVCTEGAHPATPAQDTPENVQRGSAFSG
ncbi:hypothetical protein GUJ93_ZPchr0007g5911 [Zizania palustris]|uniref:Legume lectin domain-containing protein n=1 Tax=Zizania palustris TaxID=103762 RepID=A0A8J5W503_ZIZPA|nr:hypothetical protein GUJ93_ZPchr0007g5911 [Zizania palustris]